jgi:hypothetical protein
MAQGVVRPVNEIVAPVAVLYIDAGLGPIIAGLFPETPGKSGVVVESSASPLVSNSDPSG